MRFIERKKGGKGSESQGGFTFHDHQFAVLCNGFADQLQFAFALSRFVVFDFVLATAGSLYSRPVGNTRHFQSALSLCRFSFRAIRRKSGNANALGTGQTLSTDVWRGFNFTRRRHQMEVFGCLNKCRLENALAHYRSSRSRHRIRDIWLPSVESKAIEAKSQIWNCFAPGRNRRPRGQNGDVEWPAFSAESRMANLCLDRRPLKSRCDRSYFRWPVPEAAKEAAMSSGFGKGPARNAAAARTPTGISVRWSERGSSGPS